MFHVELAPLGGIFCPLKSDLGVFWPFRGPDFIMGKNKNANFSKSPHGPIFKFCVVIREVILQKMAPILDPINFFSVLSLLDHCVFKLGKGNISHCLEWFVGSENLRRKNHSSKSSV